MTIAHIVCFLLPRVNTSSIFADLPWKVRLAITEICSLRAAGKTSRKGYNHFYCSLWAQSVVLIVHQKWHKICNLKVRSNQESSIAFIPFLLFPLSFLQASVHRVVVSVSTLFINRLVRVNKGACHSFACILFPFCVNFLWQTETVGQMCKPISSETEGNKKCDWRKQLTWQQQHHQ